MGATGLNAAAVAAHVVGAAGLLRADSGRVATQAGVGRSSAVKTAVTGAALGTAAWSALLDRRMAAAGPVPVQGATEPSAATPADVASTQRQLALVQWLNPLLAGAIVVTTAWQEEQQRAAARGQRPGWSSVTTTSPSVSTSRRSRFRSAVTTCSS